MKYKPSDLGHSTNNPNLMTVSLHTYLNLSVSPQNPHPPLLPLIRPLELSTNHSVFLVPQYDFSSDFLQPGLSIPKLRDSDLPLN